MIKDSLDIMPVCVTQLVSYVVNAYCSTADWVHFYVEKSCLICNILCVITCFFNRWG